MTIKQKQLLLAYLGYYVGNIDGKWGTLSSTACKAFQKDFGGIAVDGKCGAETEKALKHAVAYGMPVKEEKDFWEDIKYFKRAEFKCKCGGKHCNGYPAEMNEKVVRIADAAREHFGAEAVVISGLRCEVHNANEGGVKNSRHKSGKAIDMRIKGVTADALLAWMNKQSGVRYAYKINSTNVHFDVE
jgi:peptidoglycan hydrolase-like protein with peptidoglycan-binding domain